MDLMVRPIKKRIFIIGDHPMMTEWLELLIDRELDLIVCGVVNSHHDITNAISRPDLNPDLVILDLDLKGVVGPLLIHQIKLRHPSIKILIACSGYDPFLWAHCLRVGASGVINKTEQANDFKEAIYSVLKGNVYVCNKVIEILAQVSSQITDDAVFSSIKILCGRELLVFELLGYGHGPSQIAREMNISVKTVECYTERIKVKMQIKKNQDLKQYAILWQNRRYKGNINYEEATANTQSDSKVVKFDRY